MTFGKIIAEGIVPGVSSILSFIPAIAAAVFCLGILKHSGLIKGSFLPFVLGLSCSVPAIISCRAIEDKRHRLITAMLVPCFSCSAKLPIYVMMSTVFFPEHRLITILALYCIGALPAVPILYICKRRGLRPEGCSQGVEAKLSLAAAAKNIAEDVFFVCLQFIKKAFTIVLAASLATWFLCNIDTSFSQTEIIENSLLAEAGRRLTPLLKPLGFGDWRAAAALILGLSAKEAVISTLALISEGTHSIALCTMLREIFTPASAFSFMVFCLFYMPCINTIAALRSVTGKTGLCIAYFICQTCVAWLASFLIFHSIKVII